MKPGQSTVELLKQVASEMQPRRPTPHVGHTRRINEAHRSVGAMARKPVAVAVAKAVKSMEKK